MDTKRKLKECKANAHNLFSRFCLFACLFARPVLFCFCLFLAQDIFEAIVSTRDVHTSEANASTEYTSPFEQPTSQHTRRQRVPRRVCLALHACFLLRSPKKREKITAVLQAIVTLSLHLFCPGLYELKANTSTKARLHFKRWKCVTYVLAK